MHTILHEAETDDRGNKNDINPNTHSSMNPLMQYAKTHTQPQSRIHTKTQAYAAPPLRNKDQNKNTLKHHYFIIQHNGAAGRWGGLHISMCIPRT